MKKIDIERKHLFQQLAAKSRQRFQIKSLLPMRIPEILPIYDTSRIRRIKFLLSINRLK